MAQFRHRSSGYAGPTMARFGQAVIRSTRSPRAYGPLGGIGVSFPQTCTNRRGAHSAAGQCREKLLRRAFLAAVCVLALHLAGGCACPRSATTRGIQCSIAAATNTGNWHPTTPLIEHLTAVSTDEPSLFGRPFPDDMHATSVDVDAGINYLLRSPDFTAYHVLFFLKIASPDRYAGLPPESKARVLCSALSNAVQLNDFACLTPTASLDRSAGREMVSLGQTALPFLRKLLDDDREAGIGGGSEESTIAVMYGVRRNDLAYRYIMLSLGRQPSFLRTPEARDESIDALRQELIGTARGKHLGPWD